VPLPLPLQGSRVRCKRRACNACAQRGRCVSCATRAAALNLGPPPPPL
jgi:hypothetical protein